MSKIKQVKLDDAIDWTKNFRGSAPGKMKVAKAFLIPVEDLVGMLVEMNILVEKPGGLYSLDEGNDNDIRAYVGVDPTEKNAKKAGGQKLVMVATQKFPDATQPNGYMYRDIINHKIDNKGPVINANPNYVAGDDDPDTGIYDFTEPCPDACDKNSPLY